MSNDRRRGDDHEAPQGLTYAQQSLADRLGADSCLPSALPHSHSVYIYRATSTGTERRLVTEEGAILQVDVLH
jgi:hypothetical protein